jgi:hypothetical protein
MRERSNRTPKTAKRLIPQRQPGGPLTDLKQHPVTDLLAGVQLDLPPQDDTKPKSDTQGQKSRTSEQQNLGHPSNKISDIKTSETQSRTSEIDPISDIKTSEKKISDIRDTQKSRHEYDTRYELRRQADKSRDRLTLRLNINISKQIRHHCIEQGLDLTTFFESAATHYLNNLGCPSEEISDVKTSHDDRRLMMFSTRIPIINLYRAYNPKNKWKMSDDKAASVLNETDIRLIELGIIRTQFNAGFKRINSFSYYLAEIEHWRETAFDDKMLDFLVKHDREQWERATGKKLAWPEENAPT